MALTVGAYQRSSDDEREEARGVARRAADAEALAELLAGRPSGTTRDNDATPFESGTDCGVVGGLGTFGRGHNHRAMTYSDESHIRRVTSSMGWPTVPFLRRHPCPSPMRVKTAALPSRALAKRP
jgi:hypothetical protein